MNSIWYVYLINETNKAMVRVENWTMGTFIICILGNLSSTFNLPGKKQLLYGMLLSFFYSILYLVGKL